MIVCDNTDHREKGRNRLFQQWYTRLHDTAICKVDKQYRSEYYDIYSSLLIHENNPDFDNIVRAFIRLSENGFIPETENEDKNIRSRISITVRQARQNATVSNAISTHCGSG